MKSVFGSRIPLGLLFLVAASSTAEKMTEKLQLVAGALDKSADHHFLEDYYALDSNQTAETPDHEVVELAFTIPNETDGKSTFDFYKQALANLKKKSPKLEKLRLRGGFVYKPKDPKSSEELKTEISHLIDELKILDSVVNSEKIRLRRLVLSAVLGFEKNSDVNVTDILKQAYDEIQQTGDDQWNALFKIEHGRGLLKLRLLKDKEIDARPEGRSRYFPVSPFQGRMGPGPMLGSASYDPEKNVTRIWSAKSGHVELPGNHMNSEELDEYMPRNFDNE